MSNGVHFAATISPVDETALRARSTSSSSCVFTGQLPPCETAGGDRSPEVAMYL
jgi:hypothetical protein